MLTAEGDLRRPDRRRRKPIHDEKRRAAGCAAFLHIRLRPLRGREADSSVNHETDDAVHLMAVGALRGPGGGIGSRRKRGQRRGDGGGRQRLG